MRKYARLYTSLVIQHSCVCGNHGNGELISRLIYYLDLSANVSLHVISMTTINHGVKLVHADQTSLLINRNWNLGPS